MTVVAPRLKEFLDATPDVALVEVSSAKGSTPRDKGAWMLVSTSGIFATIGGGQLEYMAIDQARQLLRAKGDHREHDAKMSVPLGPEIGQCCGGRVELSVRRLDGNQRQDLLETARNEDAALPCVYLFGGGHVGHALASALALLPLRVIVVETREQELHGLPSGVETSLLPMPEIAVRDAPSGSAFLILTHDHALDFLIVAEALARPDAAYVGMIGSKSKRATFKSWYFKTAGGTQQAFDRLVSPIGGSEVNDKRPAVIAALAAAEVMTALARHQGLLKAEVALKEPRAVER